jgi:hypothetical protein
MSVRRHLPQVALFAALTVAGCASEAPQEPASEAAPAASTPAAAPASSGPRVFFIEPQDGATVKSPVLLRFGIENYGIAAVPTGDVTTSRPGVGHHHIGVDTDCLPVGSVIPKASPWVHFGDGKNEIEMQLPPGSHRLALQLGDDTHTTLTGLCTTITVNVAQ